MMKKRKKFSLVIRKSLAITLVTQQVIAAPLHYDCNPQTLSAAQKSNKLALIDVGNSKHLLCGGRTSDACNDEAVAIKENTGQTPFVKCNTTIPRPVWAVVTTDEIFTCSGLNSYNDYIQKGDFVYFFNRDTKVRPKIQNSLSGVCKVKKNEWCVNGTWNANGQCHCDKNATKPDIQTGVCPQAPEIQQQQSKTTASGKPHNEGGTDAPSDVENFAAESQQSVLVNPSETGVTSTESNICATIGKTEKEAKRGNFGFHICQITGCAGTIECNTENKTLPAHATEGHCVSAERTDYKVCTATKCDTDYTPTNGYCKKSEAPQSTETPAEEVVEEPAVVENADCTKSGGTLGENGGCTCDENKGLEPVDNANPQKCKCTESGAEYDKEKGECVSTTEQTTTVIVDEAQDEHPDCTVWDVENNKCKCDTDPNKHMETATDGSRCVCISGYTPDQTTGVCIETPTATTTPGGNTQPTEKTELETLTEKLDQAKEKYESARNKEQSLANRTLTAASTAATGLGTMAAASAYFEQQADADAESDMAAYLATFRCEYGAGQSVKSSNEEITLPGGNELLNYYSEYKTLADSLKTTKKALGLRPGIESEVLYDKAETGLYQYSSVGKTDGGFTSLARALTDETSDDAAEWAKQKDDTSTKLKAGAIAAGAGVVGGAAGNLLINNTDK